MDLSLQSNATESRKALAQTTPRAGRELVEETGDVPQISWIPTVPRRNRVHPEGHAARYSVGHGI